MATTTTLPGILLQKRTYELTFCFEQVRSKIETLVECDPQSEALKPLQEDLWRGNDKHLVLRCSIDRNKSWDSVAEMMGEACFDLTEKLVKQLLSIDREIRASDTSKALLNLEKLGNPECWKLANELIALYIQRHRDITEGELDIKNFLFGVAPPASNDDD